MSCRRRSDWLEFPLRKIHFTRERKEERAPVEIPIWRGGERREEVTVRRRARSVDVWPRRVRTDITELYC